MVKCSHFAFINRRLEIQVFLLTLRGTLHSCCILFKLRGSLPDTPLISCYFKLRDCLTTTLLMSPWLDAHQGYLQPVRVWQTAAFAWTSSSSSPLTSLSAWMEVTSHQVSGLMYSLSFGKVRGSQSAFLLLRTWNTFTRVWEVYMWLISTLVWRGWVPCSL